MHAVIAILAALVHRAATGAGTYLDVSVADGVLSLMSLHLDEHLATGAVPGAAPRPPHRPLRLLRRLSRAGTAKWLAVGAIEPQFFANLCRALGCEQWIEHQNDDAVQDDIRADFRAAFATRDRDDWVAAARAGQHLRVGRSRRCPRWSTTRTSPARDTFSDAHDAEHGDFRQLGRVLAGHGPPAALRSRSGPRP